MKYHAIPCNLMQYHAIQSNILQYDTMQYHAIQSNTMQYNQIQFNTMQYHAIQWNIMQYHAIQLNTIQCHRKENFGPKRALLGSRGPRRDPIPGQSVWWPWVQPRWAIGGRWDQIWSPGALWGPPRSPKGPFMVKMGPFCLFFIVLSSWVVPYGL